MPDQEFLNELRERLAERYTAAELVDLLDVPVEDIIEMYLDRIIDNLEMFDVR